MLIFLPVKVAPPGGVAVPGDSWQGEEARPSVPGSLLGCGFADAPQPPGSSLCSIAQRTNGIALLAVFVATGVEELHWAENSIYFY